MKRWLEYINLCIPKFYKKLKNKTNLKKNN